MIVGFCGESEADHAASLDLMAAVAYDQAFLFAYSLREKTHAARHYQVGRRRSRRMARECRMRRGT
jgi:tRNA A37 methylthiotransferase MiaB